MSFGKLNSFIEIIESVITTDEYGFSHESDTTIANIRAYKEEKNSSEAWKNRAEFTKANILFRIRRISDLKIKTNMFVICDTGRYNIVSVRDIGNKKMYLEILAESVMPSG